MKLHERGTQEKLGKMKGLCFPLLYLFGIIIIISALHQWPDGWVPDVIVSGLYLFQNPSFIIVHSVFALDILTPRAKGKTSLYRM